MTWPVKKVYPEEGLNSTKEYALKKSLMSDILETHRLENGIRILLSRKCWASLLGRDDEYIANETSCTFQPSLQSRFSRNECEQNQIVVCEGLHKNIDNIDLQFMSRIALTAVLVK